MLSYRDYFEQYRQHPEGKALDPTDHQPCHTWTRGLLHPWYIQATDQLQRVGKESNRLAATALPTEEDEAVVDYGKPERQCRGCQATVSGRRQWCSEACRKASVTAPNAPRCGFR